MSQEPTTIRDLNSAVKGTFPFNETIIAAVQYVQGVTTCPQTVSPTQQLSLTNQGSWTFDGAGNLSIDDTGVEVLVPGNGGAPATVAYSQAHCAGTYQVNKNSTVSLHYYCSVPASYPVTSSTSYATFDVHSNGVISKNLIQVAVPSAGPGQIQVTPVYLTSSSGSIPPGSPLIGCSVVGENTTVAFTSAQWQTSDNE